MPPRLRLIHPGEEGNPSPQDIVALTKCGKMIFIFATVMARLEPPKGEHKDEAFYGSTLATILIDLRLFAEGLGLDWGYIQDVSNDYFERHIRRRGFDSQGNELNSQSLDDKKE